MYTLNLSINVDLSDQTRTVINEWVNTLSAALAGRAISATDNTCGVQEVAAQEDAVQEAPAEAAADMPEGDLPCSTADLRKAVKDAKDRGVKPSVIKGVFHEFGIEASSECPEDRMEELWNRLQAL